MNREMFVIYAVVEVVGFNSLMPYHPCQDIYPYSSPFNEKWDLRFLDLARLISTWSKDPSTKVGAVIVRPDRTVVSVGFNGFPKNMPDNKEWYDNREEKYSRIVHGEINALLHANQSVKGCTLYTYPLACCDRCAVQILQAGIQNYVFPLMSEELRERWSESLKKTKQYFDQCGIFYKAYELK